MGDRAFYTFIQSLPDKERKLVLWLKSYERELKEHPDLTDLIVNLYEPEINQLLIQPKISEPPAFIPHNVPFDNDIILSKDPFEEKLGRWASDFSDDIERLIYESENP